jgi:ubiquitin C-terminal hydrolase
MVITRLMCTLGRLEMVITRMMCTSGHLVNGHHSVDVHFRASGKWTTIEGGSIHRHKKGKEESAASLKISRVIR